MGSSATVPLSSLHRSGLSLVMPESAALSGYGQSPNLACPASHLCGALRHGASCHLLLPSETAHSEHWTVREGWHCPPGAGDQEAAVPKGAE